MENRRFTALKVSVEELTGGRFVKKGGMEGSYILSHFGRRISRARIMALVVDKYISPDEKYAAITLDNGRDTIRCKSFVNIKIFNEINPGDLVDVMGKVREYGGEVYIMPEIVRKVPPNSETLRMLELNRIVLEQKKKISKLRDIKKQITDLNELKKVIIPFMPYEEAEAILEAMDAFTEIQDDEIKTAEAKDLILKAITKLDEGTGVEYKKVIAEAGVGEAVADLAIQELLQDGVCFEPTPGRIKKL